MEAPYRVRTREDLAGVERDEDNIYNLRNADLEHADLPGENLQHANFVEANLYNADLASANLEWADFENADLEMAILNEANLQQTNLESAILRGAQLRNANLLSATLVGATFTGANLTGAILRDTDMRGADLTGARIDGADFRGVILGVDENVFFADTIGTYAHGPGDENEVFDDEDAEEEAMELLQNARRQNPIDIQARRNRPRPERQTPRLREPVARANLPRVPAPDVPQEVVGIAFEIHSAFDKVNVPDLISFLEMNTEDGDILKDEFASERMTHNTFLYLINHNMREFLTNFTEKEIKSIPRKPEGYYLPNISNWVDIWNYLYNERLKAISFNDSSQRQLIGLSISYAASQPTAFQTSYALSYLDENTFAYSSGNTFRKNIGCAKGMIERFITCLNAGIDAELTSTTITNDKKREYMALKNKIQGGYDVYVAMRLITEWQNDNKNIITENGEFRANKTELVKQQRDTLIHYLCCELGVTENELMAKKEVKDTIDYAFDDDNILDNTLGGNRKRITIQKRKIAKRKTKKIAKKRKQTKRKTNQKKKTDKKKKTHKR